MISIYNTVKPVIMVIWIKNTCQFTTRIYSFSDFSKENLSFRLYFNYFIFSPDNVCIKTTCWLTTMIQILFVYISTKKNIYDEHIHTSSALNNNQGEPQYTSFTVSLNLHFHFTKMYPSFLIIYNKYHFRLPMKVMMTRIV